MLTIARKEIHDALRNHWLQGYAVLVGVLGVALATSAARGAAGLGLQTFGRTTASLTNLCLLLAPLVALSLGAAAVAAERDRGTLERLLAQPLGRGELLGGKAIGLMVSLTLANVVGFAPAAVVVVGASGWSALGGYLIFPGLATVVIAALLSVGLAVSVLSRGAAQAQARAMFLWFVFVILYDLLIMGTLMAASLRPALLAALLVANPVSAGRLLVVLSLEADLYLLGPAGAWLVEAYGGVGTAGLLLTTLAAWVAGPFLLALWSFGRPVRPDRRPTGDESVAADDRSEPSGNLSTMQRARS